MVSSQYALTLIELMKQHADSPSLQLALQQYVSRLDQLTHETFIHNVVMSQACQGHALSQVIPVFAAGYLHQQQQQE